MPRPPRADEAGVQQKGTGVNSQIDPRPLFCFTLRTAGAIFKARAGTVGFSRYTRSSPAITDQTTMALTEVELEYQRRIQAMSPMEKMSRCAAMLSWTRQQMARAIRSQFPQLSDEEVKWRVALKLYEREPEVVKLIQEQLNRVSS